MKRILILAMALTVALTFSCKKGQKEAKEETPKPETQATTQAGNPAMPMPEKEGKMLEPEKFFKFETERLGIQKVQMEKIYKLLKETKTYGPELESKIRELTQETSDKFKEVGGKHDVAYEDLKKTFEDNAAREKFNAYLADHPDIKKQLDDFQGVLKKLSDDINAEMTRLRPPEPQPPAAPQPGAPSQPNPSKP